MSSLLTLPSEGSHALPDMTLSFPCSEEATTPTTTKTPTKPASKKKLAWKKPKNMPKRPLSAYNLFFKAERRKLMDEVNADQATYELKKRQHKRTSGVGFAGLARKIAQSWKALSEKEREPFEKVAKEDRRRYHEEIKTWKQQNGDSKKARTKSLPVEGVYSNNTAAQLQEASRRASCDASSQPAYMSDQRLNYLNSSTRQTRVLLQQMATQLEALQAMSAMAHMVPMHMEPCAPMPVMSSYDPVLPMSMQMQHQPAAVAHPITPERSLKNRSFNTELPSLQPLDTDDDELEGSQHHAEDWDELVSHISEDLEDEESSLDQDSNLETLWGDVCSL